MATNQDVLGTKVCPRSFAEAASRHGRHFARYLRVVGLAGGKRVLDAACGAGFGAAYLATVAESVLGLDLDDHMLDLARSGYPAANVRFVKHDLHEPVPEAGSFGLVCSFETLEHVRRPDVCLANLASALTDDGVAAISVPNGTKEQLAGGKDFHPNQFSAVDFEQMLRRQFRDVQLFSQVYRKGIGHYLRKVTGGASHHARDYAFAPGLLDSAKTWLAICRTGD